MTLQGSITAEEAAGRDWDAIVIGAGMGGAAAAFGLARRGMSVLVVEKGLGAHTESGAITRDTDDPEARLRVGRWPVRLTGTVDGDRREFFAPLGCGTGGSSMLYAAALDRLRPSDFAPQAHPAGGTVSWPIAYDEIAPYYAEAETALGVTGTPDPTAPDLAGDLAAPPPLSPRDAQVFASLEAAGLHPFRLHCGIANRPGCDWCLGRICLSGCKRHGGNAFLAPALETGRVRLLDRAEVETLDADATRVRAVHLRDASGTVRLTARTVVLAAGAYFTPVLLLRSVSEDWPRGLGNAHDQVGRNLMFHVGRQIAIWGGKGLSTEGPRKSIAFRDLYETPAGKFGEVQSAGGEARFGNVLYALRQQVDDSPLRRVPLLRQALRIPAFVATLLFGRAAIFATIMEDFPYPENRVCLDPETPSGMRFDYVMSDELKARSRAFSGALKAALGRLPSLWLSPGPNLNYGHPCGTCRMGDDPETSVTDRDGRVHGVANLYVADASAMTTSGGTNPSLTIAANALRVADGIGAVSAE